MAMPKPRMTISKDGNVKYKEGFDQANYYLKELTRAALSDIGKYCANRFKKSYYDNNKKVKGNVGKSVKYQIEKGSRKLTLGIIAKKGGTGSDGYYGMFQEFGTVSKNGTPRIKKQGLLYKSVNDNLAIIKNIEATYLSALDGDSLMPVNDADLEGGAD